MKLIDTFQNLLKSLGTSKDYRQNTVVVPDRIIDRVTATTLYGSNWLAKKVIDTPVDDAARNWRYYIHEDPNVVDEMKKLEKDWKIKTKFVQAQKWARALGGAAIVIIIDGDDPTEPFDVSTMRESSLKNLLVLDRWNIIPDLIDQDILSSNFGRPENYTIVRAGQSIHESRVIRFEGIETTIEEKEMRTYYWGDSMFRHLFDPISDSVMTSHNIANLVYEAAIDVYGIDGLNEMLAESGDNGVELVKTRLSTVHKMKGILNAVVLDSDDKYEKKSTNFANLADIDSAMVQKVSASSGIPATKLLGISPGGLNATGESDLNNYYDLVSSEIQECAWSDNLNFIDTLLAANARVDSENLSFKFFPLKQMSEKEQAEVENLRADRDQKYIAQGVIEISDVLNNLHVNETYGSITSERVQEMQELETSIEEPGPEENSEYGEEEN